MPGHCSQAEVLPAGLLQCSHRSVGQQSHSFLWSLWEPQPGLRGGACAGNPTGLWLSAGTLSRPGKRPDPHLPPIKSGVWGGGHMLRSDIPVITMCS